MKCKLTSRLTSYHWQVLFGVYNVTLTGKYITILPSICISIPIQPKNVTAHRNSMSNSIQFNRNWQALSRAFDTIDMDRDDYDDIKPTGSPLGRNIKHGFISDDDDPYIPSSPIELALTVLLAIPSLIFIKYVQT